MDDNTLRVAFPVGNTEVIVTRPTDGQALALALSREPKNKDERVKLIRRLARVLEAVMGPEQWDSVFEAGMIDGTIPPEALASLSADIIGFDWDSLTPDPEPGDINALDEPEPVMTRPGPRIVSGA